MIRLPHDLWRYRPESEVTGWVAACECGWWGEQWGRSDDVNDVDLATWRVCPDGSVAPPEVKAACHDEWMARATAT